jgi:thioredoxin-like negative regulator of GroEL
MQVSSSFFSGVNIVSKRPTIVLFYMDRCSHCQEMKPEWAEFVHRSPVQTVSFNMATATSPLRKALTRDLVEGVPTIILYLDGKPYVTYTGPNTKEGFMQFAATRANLNFERVGR